MKTSVSFGTQIQQVLKIMKLVFKEDINFENNRYSAKLPVKEFHPILPHNYLLSLKKLNKLKERLNRNRELLKHYDDIFQEQLQAGIIEEVHDEGECGIVTYLPHSEVAKDQSITTKVWIIFDPSARLKGKPCLNDILYNEPCLNPELYNLLLKFRVYPVEITGDIEKAYLQMGINKPCTHLNPAPSTSTQPHLAPSTFYQLILTFTQLHRPPPRSCLCPPTSLQHSQKYLDQNIASNWAISQNLGRKIKSCPF